MIYDVSLHYSRIKVSKSQCLLYYSVTSHSHTHAHSKLRQLIIYHISFYIEYSKE